MYKKDFKNHQTSPRDSPDDFKKSKKKSLTKKTIDESILLINLSQTAYFDGLTLPDCRKWYGDSTGLNNKEKKQVRSGLSRSLPDRLPMVLCPSVFRRVSSE